MEFKKNELINEVLTNYYQTFSMTLDTMDYVPERYNKKIIRFIYKNMKQKFKEVKKEHRKFLIHEQKQLRIKKQQQKNNAFAKHIILENRILRKLQKQKKRNKKTRLAVLVAFLFRNRVKSTHEPTQNP